MGRFPVEAAGNGALELLDLGQIVGLDHSAGEAGQFILRQRTLACQPQGEVDDLRLTRRRQLADFLDDGCGIRGANVPELAGNFNFSQRESDFSAGNAACR
ncbi:MAG: hypothetical protein WCS99_15320 [Limisphaerales bacterium]